MTSWLGELEKSISDLVECQVGHTKYTTNNVLSSSFVLIDFWKELIKHWEPNNKVNSISLQGGTPQAQIADLVNYLPLEIKQYTKVDAVANGKKIALFDLLVRMVYYYLFTKPGTLSDKVIAWRDSFVKDYPTCTFDSWETSSPFYEKLGVHGSKSINLNYEGKVDEQEEPWKTYLTKANELRKNLKPRLLDNQIKQRVIEGLLEDLDFWKLERLGKCKMVRLFTSSTFTDTEHERNMLMKGAYPFLRLLCNIFGCGFEVVDMRWGVLETTNLEHSTGELCLTELKKCKEISMGPAFMTLLGNKYGYRPLPKYVKKDHLDKIWDYLKAKEIDEIRKRFPVNPTTDSLVRIIQTSSLETVWNKSISVVPESLLLEKESLLIPMWYFLDQNHLPCAYSLLPIPQRLTDYISKDPAKSKAASGKWWNMVSVMLQQLRMGATNLQKTDQLQFISAITEQEVRQGILDNRSCNEQSYCFLRSIEDLPSHLKLDLAVRYTDISKNPQADKEAARLLQTLKDQCSHLLKPKRVSTYAIQGPQICLPVQPQGPDVKYLEKFRDDFCSKIVEGIFDGVKESTVDVEPHVDEAIQHHLFFKAKSSWFVERPVVMAPIYKYLDSVSPKKPLVISGESGSGKTACVAGAINYVASKHKNSKDTIILYRFLGTTPNSSTVRNLLYSLCQQLLSSIDDNISSIPTTFMNLVAFFPNAIAKVAAKKKVILFLDSLDQLSGEQQIIDDGWIPKSLCDNFHLVLSMYL